MNVINLKEIIDQCLKNAEIDEALRITGDFCRENRHTKSYEKIVVLNARWVKTQSEHRLGILNDFESNKVLGQTIMEIKEIINKLEETKFVSPKNKYINMYIILAILTSIFIIGYIYYSKLKNFDTSSSGTVTKSLSKNIKPVDSLPKDKISNDRIGLDKSKINDETIKKNTHSKFPSPKPSKAVDIQKYKLKVIIPSRMSDGIIFIDGKEPNIIDRTTNFIYIEVPQKEENYEIRIDKSGQESCILKIAIRTDNTILYPCQ